MGRHLEAVKLIDTIQAAFFTAHTHVPQHNLEVNNLNFHVCAVLFVLQFPSCLNFTLFLIEFIKEFKQSKSQVLLTHASDEVCISLNYCLV